MIAWLARPAQGVRAVTGFRCRVTGLALNFIGSVLAGLAGYQGLVTGYGSSGTAWLSTAWSTTWLAGWVLFIVGFSLQVAGEFLGRRR